MPNKEVEMICPDSPAGWRAWLQENHATKSAVWLVFHKKATSRRALSWSEAVDEALCFGWIDSIARSIDGERYKQFFGKRKPGSVWSKINKEKVERLEAEGLMEEAGLKSVAIAKGNGSWTILDSAEAFKIPKDLGAAFRLHPGSRRYFSALPKSIQKGMLQWVVTAKRPETRQRRIDEIAACAGQKIKPKQF